VIIEMDMYSEIRARYSNGESLRFIARGLKSPGRPSKSIMKSQPIRKFARHISENRISE
jgi:hypothetical protein